MTSIMAAEQGRTGSLKILILLVFVSLTNLNYGNHKHFGNSLMSFGGENNATTSFMTIKSLKQVSRSTRGRGKLFFYSRVLYSVNGTSSFQSPRIVLGGDIQTNPGPNIKRTPRYPCRECAKNVRSNQDAILCVKCNYWTHAKCLGLTKQQFKYYLDHPDIDWICVMCSLPFVDADFSLEDISNSEINISLDSSRNTKDIPKYHLDAEQRNGISFEEQSTCNTPERQPDLCTIVDQRMRDSSAAFIAHLNINSIQNKFEELEMLNRSLKAQVLILSETKIDSSYPNSQFSLNGYHMFRKDRVKGGGGLLVYVSTVIPSRRLTLPKTYKTLEALAVDVKIGRQDILILSIYRPPKNSKRSGSSRHDYLQCVEDEVNCTSVSGHPSQRKTSSSLGT